MVLRLVAFVVVLGTLLSSQGQGVLAVKGKATAGQGVIEEVNGRQLTKLLQDKDYVAVFWCEFYFFFTFYCIRVYVWCLIIDSTLTR